METRRFTNPSQPQTLQGAVILMYFDAVLGVIGLRSSGFAVLPAIVAFVAFIGFGVCGFGIANDRKWGYTGGVAIAGIELVLWTYRIFDVGGIPLGWLIAIAFSVLLLALLLHPMSREHQRIWFK